MVERRDGAGLPLEGAADVLRADLNRNMTLEATVESPEILPTPPFPNRASIRQTPKRVPHVNALSRSWSLNAARDQER